MTSTWHRTALLGRATVVAVLVGLGSRAAAGQCAPATQRLVSDHKFDQARGEVQKLLAKNASDDAALDCMGRIDLEDDKSSDAVDWLEKAVKANDRSAVHHLWLGNALGTEAEKASKLRQPFLARRVKSEFERAVALDPTLVDARVGLIQFYSRAPAIMGGSMDRAAEQVAEIARLNAVRGHLEGGRLAEQRNDSLTAEREYVAAVAAGPDSIAAYNLLAGFYRRHKRWSEAIATYERLLHAVPDALNAHLNIATVILQSNEGLGRAEQETRRWLADPPKNAPVTNYSAAHQILGTLYERAGKKDSARKEYELALSLNARNEGARKALAALK